MGKCGIRREGAATGIAVAAAAAAAVLLMAALGSRTAGAASVPLEDRKDAGPFIIEATAYCDAGVTASGHPTVEGLTLAGPEEWLGCAAVIWLVDDDGSMGDCLGIYQFTDTGGDRRIRDGECIDIYMPDEADCIEWGRREVWMQVIDGRG